MVRMNKNCSILHKHLLGLLLLGISLSARAQKADTVLFKVVYDFKHVENLAEPQELFRNDMLLQVGKNYSKYMTAIYSKQLPPPKVISDKKVTTNTVAEASKGISLSVMGIPMASVTAGVMSNEHLYQFRAEKQLMVTDYVGLKQLGYAQPLPKIDWKLYDDKKMIGGLACQKAIGSYAGRVYEAWFTPEIPLPYGPWKLHGLPGIILEAVDQTGTVQFLFKDLKKGDGNELAYIYDSNRLVQVKLNEYNQMKARLYNDPAGLVSAQAQLTNTSVLVTYRDVPDSSYSGTAAERMIKKLAEKKITNPLEIRK